MRHDINFLELKAILSAVQTRAKDKQDCHIQIQSDNTSAEEGINRQGSTHSKSCNSLAREIWLWAMQRNLWLSAAHCPRIHNTQANQASWVFNDNTEWMLNRTLFSELCKSFGTTVIDLFASHLNSQLLQYCSWQPDPGATVFDSFTTDWGQFTLIYCFPPVSLVGRTLHKVRRECPRALVVIPDWPSQPWFPLLRQMTPPHSIPVTANSSNYLTISLQSSPAGRATACLVSGISTTRRGFQPAQLTS